MIQSSSNGIPAYMNVTPAGTGYGGDGFGMGAINGVGANVNGVGAQVSNGFAQAEIAANGRQMADMQMQYQGQMNTMQQFFDMMRGFDSCCCDNKLATADLKATVLQENCADRNALSEAMMQLYMNNTANTQRLVDTINQIGTNLNNKLCQLEMDGKNDKIADLQRQLSEANLANVVRQACGCGNQCC